jgi:hypothetical protein
MHEERDKVGYSGPRRSADVLRVLVIALSLSDWRGSNYWKWFANN